MKRKRLLLLLASALVGMYGANAATWQEPTLSYANFAANDTLYFNNVETSKFFGAAQNTPSLSQTGLEIVPIANSDGSYSLKCSSDGTNFTYLYVVDQQNLSIAGTDSTKHNTFTIDDNGDGSFKIRPCKDDAEYGEGIYVDFFCGVSDFTTSSTIAPLVMVDPTVSNAIIWKAVKVKNYIDYTAKNNLSLAMTKAQNYGLDITAALETYNNSASTNDELIAATTKLNGVILAYEIEHASDKNPVDFSSKIANASCGALDGWVMNPKDAFNNNNSKGYNWCGGPSDGAIETWIGGGGNLTNRSMTQSFTNLPNGKYLVGAFIVAAQQGNNPEVADAQHGVYLYAKGSGLETRVNASTVGYNAVHYVDSAYVNDGTLTMGIVVENCNCNWICLDNFSLQFCGTGSMVSDMKSKLQSSIDSAAIVLAAGEMTPSYVEELKAKKAEAETLAGKADVTFDQVKEMYNALNGAIADAAGNQKAYVSLQNAFNEANTALGSFSIETVQVTNLSDYLNDHDIDIMMSEKTLSTDSINSIITALKKLTVSAGNSQLAPGSDVTYLIKDAGFDGDHTVWGSSLCDFDKGNSLAYKWCSGFDMNQTFEDVPAGTYKLQVQAFDRPILWGKDEAYEYDQWVADPVSRANAVGLTIYMNSDEKKVKNWFAEGDKGITEGYQTSAGWYVPARNPWNDGGTGNIKKFFDAGLFDNEVTTVVTDGTLKLGIKSGFLCWGAFDNFRLTYVGPDREDGVALLQSKVDAGNKALLSKMNGDLRKELEFLTDSSTKVLNDENSSFSKMIVLSNKLSKLLPSVNNSVNHYRTLFVIDSIVGLSMVKPEVVATDSGTLLKASYDAATAIYAMDYPTYVDKDIDSLYALFGKLLVDANAQAYITATGDVTTALVNPSFDFGNSFGWANDYPTVTFTEAEVYNRTFNIYQTLHGVPNGKYVLKAQAYFRPLAIADAVKNYTGGTPDVVKSFLYANNDSVAVKHICSEASPTKLFNWSDWQTDYGYTVGADSAYVPASMHGGSCYLAAGKYENEVSTVVKDHTLRIGLTMPDATGNSDYWTLFDNFRLSYVDANGIVNAQNATNTVSVKVYDVNGMQKSKLTKGLNIVKKVMSDGSVVVEKIAVK